MLKASINSQTQIASDILLQIFLYLDIKSIRSCLSTCKQFYYIIEEQLWKHLLIRDYYHFLYMVPLPEEQLAFPQKESDIETFPADLDKEKTVHENPFSDPLTEDEQIRLQQNLVNIQNFKEAYIKCHSLPHISGYYVGDYASHGFELIKIIQRGYKVYARKLTGDPNIPAKKLTWRMHLGENMISGKGYIHLADTGYVDPNWSTAFIDSSEKNVIKITWFLQDEFNNWYYLTYCNVKAGCKDFGPEMNERIDMLILDDDDEEED